MACRAPLGPGYEITHQQIRVHFVPEPNPHIRVEAAYDLRNNGYESLPQMELLLPSPRRFHFAPPSVLWDGQPLRLEASGARLREVVLRLPEPWRGSAHHTLLVSIDFQNGPAGEHTLGFKSDAFFLPAEGWSPVPLPARGLFATGGVPPQAWDLLVTVPEGFLVHPSGRPLKSTRRGSEQVLRAMHGFRDQFPMVIAGRFTAAQVSAGKSQVHLWTRAPLDVAALRGLGQALTRAMDSYDASFGRRAATSGDLWIVECPEVADCFSSSVSPYAKLILGEDETRAELVSSDTVIVDPRIGPRDMAATVAPSLAASWLGYAQSPGFFQQTPPLSALPAFAAAIGREAVVGGQIRSEIIRRALSVIPMGLKQAGEEDPDVLRARSLLFFYGLQDRYGREAVSGAIRYMLSARRERGFILSDLIAALEAESHQNVAEFVRLWMKHPGVPVEFRARYQQQSVVTSIKESTP